nr:hypothetical protein [Azospirillum sp. 412522]
MAVIDAETDEKLQILLDRIVPAALGCREQTPGSMAGQARTNRPLLARCRRHLHHR